MAIDWSNAINQNLAGSQAGGQSGFGAIGGMVGGTLGLLNGIFGGDPYRKQYKWQAKLNEQAAEVNYRYGELAAQNAFNRQMQMYERSYKDQSYEAIRRQMEGAGLSVGLMYGGGGGSGGGAGATSGAPMGETGGAVAGRAPTPAEMKQARAAEMGMALQLAKLGSEIAVNKSMANRNNAEAGKATEDAETTKAIRPFTVRGAEEGAKNTWIQNLRNMFEDSTTQGPDDKLEAVDDMFGEYSIIGKRLKTQTDWADLNKKVTEGLKNIGDNEAAKAIARLNNTKAENYWRELVIAAAHADAHKMEAAAKKLAAEFQTGDYTTWKTWYTMGIDVLAMIASAVGGVNMMRTGGALKRKLDAETGKIQNVMK